MYEHILVSDNPPFNEHAHHASWRNTSLVKVAIGPLGWGVRDKETRRLGYLRENLEELRPFSFRLLEGRTAARSRLRNKDTEYK